MPHIDVIGAVGNADLTGKDAPPLRWQMPRHMFLSGRSQPHLFLAWVPLLWFPRRRMIDMPAPRSSTAKVKTAGTAAPKPAVGPGPAAKPAARAAAPRRRSKAAEMLREIQIDGKALSVQIERLRHRFL
jgi:hypothetical protein